MGCTESVHTRAETFFAGPYPSPNEPKLIEGLPSTLRMDPWNVLTRGTVSVTNDPQGEGHAQTLGIYGPSDDTPLAHLHVPPHRSFGQGATLKDATGTDVAHLRTMHQERQPGMLQSSYCVLSTKPKLADHAPASDGLYLWATVTRSPFTSKVNITNPAGTVIASGEHYSGPAKAPPRYAIKAASGEGVMLADRTPEKPKRHAIQTASGADPALAICLMMAAYLSFDEMLLGNSDAQPDFWF